MTLDPQPSEIEPRSPQHAAGQSTGTGRQASDVAQVVIELEGSVQRVFQLTEQAVTIGRTPGNTLALQHEAVSRSHAELRLTPEGLILTDTGSMNGTFVGTTRLAAHQPVRLAPGSIIRIGPFILRYELFHLGEQAAPALNASEERSAMPVATQAVADVPLPTAYSPPPPPRDLLPMPLPNGAASNYLDFLPIIFHDSDFMSRFLLIFQSIWEPIEQRQDHLAMLFDPRTCPAPFLHWLAGWMGVAVGPRWPEGRLRTLLAEAVELYRWRGTQYGLTRMIEVCTGLTPVIAETAANPFVLHIRIAIPPESDVDRDVIERLIVANKPAHTAYFLELAV